MKIFSIVIFVALQYNNLAISQIKFAITPFVGTNLTINSNDNSAQNINTPNNDFQFVYPKIHYSYLQPLTFGLLVDYSKNRLRYSTGIIFSDHIGSYMNYGIPIPTPNSPFSQIGYSAGTVWLARAATKIPFDFTFKILSAHHIGNTKSFFDLRIKTGFNILLMRRWDENSFGGDMIAFTENGENAFMIQPDSYAFNTIDGNQAGIIIWECNLQKGWSVNFKAGFDIDWYIKNKRRITTSFYYEQGTRNMSAMVNQVFYNGAYQGSNIVYSRGSAIQFKIGFPIQLFSK